MSELWIVIPPPRREPEVTLTVVLAVALTVHAVPLGPLLFDNPSPALARQQAIEQARFGGIGSFAIEEHHHDPDECPTSACVAQVLKTIELPEAGEPTPARVTLRYGTTERSAGVLVR